MKRPDWTAIRLRLYMRAFGCCERCGATLGGGWEAHHRRPKGMGGTLRVETHAPSNLLVLCQPCHVVVHAHPEDSRRDGYLVSQVSLPSRVPVTVAYGYESGCAPVWLTDDYGYEPVAAAVAE